MASIRFSLCPACDCESFDFYDTTGRAPGRPEGYGASLDLSTLSGEITFRKMDGTVAGTYSFPPSDDPSTYINILYASDSSNTISDGAYDVTYEVRDTSDNIIGSATQPVMITCSLQCELEKMIDSYTSASGHGKDVLREKVNEISNRIRMANWLAQSGYTEKANQELVIAKDYV